MYDALSVLLHHRIKINKTATFAILKLNYSCILNKKNNFRTSYQIDRVHLNEYFASELCFVK